MEKANKSNEYMNTGLAYLSTTDKKSVINMIKLHYHVYASYRLKTYLMGYPYDGLDDALDDT